MKRLQQPTFTGHPVDVVSGAVYTRVEDYSITGRTDLVWTRLYSTAFLERPASTLGPGWTASLLSTLRFDGEAYTFIGPDGDEDVFEDPEGILNQGGVLRNLGSFQELRRDRDRYFVNRWEADAFGVTRFVFPAGAPGCDWPLLSVEDTSGQGVDFAYDQHTRLVWLRQRREQRGFALSYDAAGRLAELRFLDQAGRAGRLLARYEYDRSGRLAAAYDALGFPDRYLYDDSGRLTGEVRRDGGRYRFSFDAEGRCVETTGQDDYDRRELRYVDEALTTEVTDSTGQVWRYHWNLSGQVERIVSPLGAVQATNYDEFGRVIEITDPNGAATKYEYDASGNRAAVVKPSGAALKYEFSPDRQPVLNLDEAGNPWKREYDERGYPLADEDPANNRWKYHYDSQGDLLAIEDPLGARKHLSYNRQGEVTGETDWEGNVTRFSWDEEGRLTGRIDPLGQRTSLAYDARGLVTGMQFADGASIRVGYDSAGNPVQIVDPAGRVTRFTYGPCGLFLEQVNADGGRERYVWGTEPGRLLEIHNEKGEIQRFRYGAAGHLVGASGFDGREIGFSYDPAGNCESIREGGTVTRFERDSLGQVTKTLHSDGTVITDAYDAAGWLVRSSMGRLEASLNRDALGRVVLERQGEFEIASEFDPLGRPIRSKTNTGREVEWRYDRNGLLKELHSSSGASVRFERDPLGREVRRQLPGGAQIRSEYDVLDRLVRRWVESAGSGQVSDRRYSYDRAGNLALLQDSRWGSVRYQYDACDRLLSALGERSWDEEFRYDLAGNLLSISRTTRGSMPPGARLPGGDRGARPTHLSCHYGAGNRLLRTGDLTYDYDDRGRLVRAGSDFLDAREFGWTDADDLKLVRLPDGSETAFNYDPFGRRIAEYGPGGKRVWRWSDYTLCEFQDGTHAPVHYLFEPGTFEPILREAPDQLYFYVLDHIGSPRDLIGGDGRLAWSALLSSWGEVAEIAPQLSEELRFQGQFADALTGLHYNRFRYYYPAVGRYISQDPLGPSGDLNPYRYTYNPVNWVDPLGLIPCLGAIKAKIAQVLAYLNRVGYVPFINPAAIYRALRGRAADRLFGLARFQRGGRLWGIFDGRSRFDYGPGGYGRGVNVPHWHWGADPPGSHRVPFFVQRRLASRGLYPYTSFMHGGAAGIDPSVRPHAHP